MSKQIHFLTGLPRSGGTLLAAILNQNKDVFVSPLSPLPELLYQAHNIRESNENTIRSAGQKIRMTEAMSVIPSVFYSNVQMPIIIDRSKAWGSPAHLPLIQEFITPTPKIIYTVRNITDIIASYIKLNIEPFKQDYFSGELFSSYYRTDSDGMAEYIMRLNGPIDSALCNLANCLKQENKNYIHIVEYDSLVDKPQETLDGIYGFLNLPKYKHDFSNILKLEIDNDTALGFPENMHEVSHSITKSKTDSKLTLSPYIYAKYSNMEFWRENSLMELK
jgi:sulfotransferase